jgi:hypothetical protein
MTAALLAGLTFILGIATKLWAELKPLNKYGSDPSPPPDKNLLGTFHGAKGREITISRPWYRLGRGVKVSGLKDPEWDGDAWAIRASSCSTNAG